MEETDLPEKQKQYGSFVIGVLLAYGVCALMAGRTFASDMRVAIEIGLFAGLCPFLPLAPIHFLMQKVLHWMLAKLLPLEHCNRWAFLYLNLPVLILFLALLASVIIPPSQAAKTRMFTVVTKQAPPSSLQMVGYNMLQGMNDGHCHLAFTISESDLNQLLKTLNLSTNHSDLDEEAIRRYRDIAQETGASSFKLEAPGTLYETQSVDGIKHSWTGIVIGKNRQEVLLLDAFN